MTPVAQRTDAAATVPRPVRGKTVTRYSVLRWVFLGFWLTVTLVPLVVLVLQSLARLNSDANAIGWPHHFDLSSYSQAFKYGRLGAAYAGSAIVVGGSVLAAVVMGAFAAYPLARKKHWVVSGITLLLIASFVLPPALSIVPLYAELRGFHLLGSYWGLVLVYTASLFPWSTFMYLGFIRAIPRELEEAARVDGASPLRVFLHVVFPLLRPVTTSVAIILGLFIWNDFFTPFVFLTGSKTTVARAIYELGSGTSSGAIQSIVTPFPVIFAGVIVTTIPVLILFFALQRHFVSGLTRGAVKG